MTESRDPPLVRPRAPTLVTGRLSGRQYREMRLRAKTLGLPPAAITACQTMGELKPLVRRCFLQLAKRWHPDTLPHRSCHAHHGTGAKFRRMSQLYAWFKAQPDGVRLVHPETVPDHDLPWAMSWKDIALPPGYQEDWSWLAWR